MYFNGIMFLLKNCAINIIHLLHRYTNYLGRIWTEFFRSFELHRHFLTCQTQLLGTEHNKASSQLDKGHAASIPKINRNYMKLWSRHTVEHMDLYMIMAQSTYEWLFSSIILKEMVIYLKSLPENPTYRYVSITTL